MVMADLENLLLEAAGRTGASGRKQHSRPQSKRRREGSYSDEGSDSKDNDSDSPGFTSRKPSGSQVPLKKRLDPSEKDDDRGSQGDDDEDDDDHGGGSGDESDSAPSVGSDLYKDDADREALAKMSELQREMILSDRASVRDDYQLKKKVRALQQSEKKPRPTKEPPPPPPVRGRSSGKTDKAKVALNELRARRLKAQDLDGLRKIRDVAGSGRDASPVRRKPAVAATSSSSDSRSSESESESESKSGDEGSMGGGELAESDEDGPVSGIETPSYEEIKDITIRRSKLAKWFMEPFFEELIVGCFVRVGIGMSRSGQSIYRLCIVRNVDATDPDRQYRLENRTTHKYLNCIWGNENSAARWQMARVSDSDPLEKEFHELLREVERSGGRMPSRQDVMEKREEIQKINTFVYSAATVKQMLQEKKSASSRPLNIAAEKDRLRKEMEVAESRKDDTEVERIKAKFQELEVLSRQGKHKDAKAVMLAEMNKRNRAENFKNASEVRPVNTGLKAGEAGYDPFSRRWTRSRNYYEAKPGGGSDGEAGEGVVVAGGGVVGDGEGGGAVSEAGEAATVAALEAAADAGKLVDTSAPVGQGTESHSLHNFELPISLAGLQKFGGAQGAHLGFMARKQRIEATIGYKVPDNDGRIHALTLTVSDYKRRRGLL